MSDPWSSLPLLPPSTFLACPVKGVEGSSSVHASEFRHVGGVDADTTLRRNLGMLTHLAQTLSQPLTHGVRRYQPSQGQVQAAWHQIRALVGETPDVQLMTRYLQGVWCMQSETSTKKRREMDTEDMETEDEAP